MLGLSLFWGKNIYFSVGWAGGDYLFSQSHFKIKIIKKYKLSKLFKE